MPNQLFCKLWLFAAAGGGRAPLTRNCNTLQKRTTLVQVTCHNNFSVLYKFHSHKHKRNPLNTQLRPLYLRPSPYSFLNTLHLCYKNQSIYAVSGTSRCLFWDKYKTHKHSVGIAYCCWMLNWWFITWPVGSKSLKRAVTHLLFTHMFPQLHLLHCQEQIKEWRRYICYFLQLFSLFTDVLI